MEREGETVLARVARAVARVVTAFSRASTVSFGPAARCAFFPFARSCFSDANGTSVLDSIYVPLWTDGRLRQPQHYHEVSVGLGSGVQTQREHMCSFESIRDVGRCFL